MDQEKIFEKAKELSELIAHSDIKKRADEANRALTGDAEAVDLINGYNDKRQEKWSSFRIVSLRRMRQRKSTNISSRSLTKWHKMP